MNLFTYLTGIKKMGQRISFLRSNNRNTLRENIISQYNEFRTWALNEDKESRMYYGQDFISPALRDFLNSTKDLKNIEGIDAVVLDDLTSEFVGAFCDYGGGKELYTLCDPTMSKWRYYNSSQLIDANCDDEIKRIWKYLHDGRSLNNQPFSNLDDDYKIGFWTYEEQQYLLNSILRYFGSEKNIRQKYWTDQEKEIYKKIVQESSKRKYVAVTDFNPKSEGIEFVLQLLHETTNYKTEIVFGIE